MKNEHLLLIGAVGIGAAYFISQQKKKENPTVINQTTPTQRNPNTSKLDNYVGVVNAVARTGQEVLRTFNGGGNSGAETSAAFRTLELVGNLTGGHSQDGEKRLA